MAGSVLNPQIATSVSAAAAATIGRTVHVKIRPRPRSIAESEQVLYELRRFGEVQVYRHLKYEGSSPAPNSAIAVYKTVKSAKRAIEANIVKFVYEGAGVPQQQNTMVNKWNQHTVAVRKAENESVSAALETKDEELAHPTLPYPRDAELNIRASGLSHAAQIARGFYVGPFTFHETHAPGISLLGYLPPGLQGMKSLDIMKGEIPLSKRREWAEKEVKAVVSRGWKTLQELWDQGEKKRATKQYKGAAQKQ